MTLPFISKQNKFGVWYFFYLFIFHVASYLKRLHILLFIILYLLNFHAKLCSTNDDDLFSIQHNSIQSILIGIEIEFNWIILLITIKLVLTTIKLKTFLGAF
jgi:hypothetical protein